MATNGTSSVRTLLLSGRPDVIEQLRRILATDVGLQSRVAGTVEAAAQALQAGQVDIVLVDDVLSDSTPLETIRRLATNMPQVPVVALADQMAVAYVREALLAGARAFITKPLHETEVLNTLRQVVQMESLRRTQAHEHAPNGKRKSHVISVMSPKGGVGSSMLAVNLAILLRKKTKASVALVESQGSLGDLEPMLNLHAQFTCGDMLGRGDQLDADLLAGMLADHQSGIKVLVSSRHLEDNSLMNSDTFEAIVRHLSESVDFIVIDSGSIAEEQTSVALTRADTVLLITTPEVSSLRRVALFLEAAERAGFPREKLNLVVNRDGEPGGVSAKEISQHLSLRVTATIPDDTALVVDSLNRGIPLVLNDSRSAVARSIDRLVDSIIPKPGGPEQSGQRSSGLMNRLSTMLNLNPA